MTLDQLAATAAWLKNPLAHGIFYSKVFLCYNLAISHSYIQQFSAMNFLNLVVKCIFSSVKSQLWCSFAHCFPIFKVDFCPWEHKFLQAILVSLSVMPYTAVKSFYFSYSLCSFIYPTITTLIPLATALSRICMFSDFHNCIFPWQSPSFYIDWSVKRASKTCDPKNT